MHRSFFFNHQHKTAPYEALRPYAHSIFVLISRAFGGFKQTPVHELTSKICGVTQHKRARFTLLFLLWALIICSTSCSTPSIEKVSSRYSRKYKGSSPGLLVCPATKLDTEEKVIALTFDACGGRGGNGYDRRLIDFLRENKIKATLFINVRWARANAEVFKVLCNDPLFEIESHGYRHCPCTISPAEKYGIKATSSIPVLIEEVERSSRELQLMGASRPSYFRSGTAWYDQCSIKIIEELGYSVVNFDINSRDFNKYHSAEKIASYINKARAGSIVVMHMNHPSWNTNEGFRIAYPLLKKRGYSFVHVKDYGLKSTMRTRLPR